MPPESPVTRYFGGESASEWTPAAWVWSSNTVQPAQPKARPRHRPQPREVAPYHWGLLWGPSLGETSGPEWVIWISGPVGVGDPSRRQ